MKTKKLFVSIVLAMLLSSMLAVLAGYSRSETQNDTGLLREEVPKTQALLSYISLRYPSKDTVTVVSRVFGFYAEAYDINNELIDNPASLWWQMKLNDTTNPSQRPMGTLVQDQTEQWKATFTALNARLTYDAINQTWVWGTGMCVVYITATDNQTTPPTIKSFEANITVMDSLENYANVTSVPNVVYPPLEVVPKNTAIKVNIKIDTVRHKDIIFYKDMEDLSYVFVNASSKNWNGTLYPSSGEVVLSCTYVTSKYMYGYIANTIYFPAGSWVKWHIYAIMKNYSSGVLMREQPRSETLPYVNPGLGNPQNPNDRWTFEVRGAWYHSRRTIKDERYLLLSNVQVDATYMHTQINIRDPVTVTIINNQTLAEDRHMNMYAYMYYRVKPDPVTKKDIWTKWGGGIFTPLYQKEISYVITGYDPGTWVQFYIMVRDEDACPYYHWIGGAGPEFYYQYNVSYGGLFIPGPWGLNINITSTPDVIFTNRTGTDPNTGYGLHQNDTVTVKIESIDKTVSIYGAAIYWAFTWGSTTGQGSAMMIQKSSIEQEYTLPSFIQGMHVRFSVTAWDRNRTALSSPLYFYDIILNTTEGDIADVAFFIVDCIDSKLKTEGKNPYIKGVIVNITNETHRMYSETTTDDVGMTYFPAADGTTPKYFRIGTEFKLNITYKKAKMRLLFTYTLKKTQFEEIYFTGEKLMKDGKDLGFVGDKNTVYVKVGLENLTVMVYFFPDEKSIPPVYAKVEPFPQWWVWIAPIVVCVLTIPVAMNLLKMRKKKEEEEKRITL